MSFRGRSRGRGPRYNPRGRNFRGGFKPYNNNRDFGSRGRDYSPDRSRHPRSSKHGGDLLSNLDPRDQLELTKALVASVLKNDDHDRKGGYRDRDGYRDAGRDKRDFGERDGQRAYRSSQDGGNYGRYEGRSYKDRRQYEGDRGSYSGSRRYESENPTHSKYYGREKKDGYEMDDSVPVRKKARTDEGYKTGGRRRAESISDYGHQKEYKSYEKKVREKEFKDKYEEEEYVKREKKKAKKRAKSSDSRHSASEREEEETSKRKKMKKPKVKTDDIDEEANDVRADERVNGSKERKKRKSYSQSSDREEEKEAEEEVVEEGEQGEKSEESSQKESTRSHLSGRSLGGKKISFKLECPHCPGEVYATVADYRYHLKGSKHWNNFEAITRSNWQVMKKLRFNQRELQRSLEDKWQEDDPEEFATTVKSYCQECMLTFRVRKSAQVEGKTEHRKSRLHRMQVKYMRPKCHVCNMVFPKRATYEMHRSTVTHLRVKALLNENKENSEESKDKSAEGENKEKIDLGNLITVDSVGAEEGSDAELAAVIEEVNEEYRRRAQARKERIKKEKEHQKIPLEMDWTEEEKKDLSDGNAKGEEYVCKIEASFCKLCCKVIRLDSQLGSEAIKIHCRSQTHLQHFKELQSENCMAENSHLENELEQAEVNEESDKEENHEESMEGAEVKEENGEAETSDKEVNASEGEQDDDEHVYEEVGDEYLEHEDHLDHEVDEDEGQDYEADGDHHGAEEEEDVEGEHEAGPMMAIRPVGDVEPKASVIMGIRRSIKAMKRKSERRNSRINMRKKSM